jgi:RNA polymerase sigma factor (sigma-70 family)
MSRDPTDGAKAALEQEWLGTLFTAHAERLYRLARRLSPGPDEALDLVQETFLRVAKSPTRPPPGAEAGWLVRILVNIRRDQWRHEAVCRRDAPYLRAAASVDPRREYVLRLAVWQALEELSPRRRAVLVMHELDGLSVAVIASLLGITTITVRWHLARARRELAARMRSDEGETRGHTESTPEGRRPTAARSDAES